MRKIHFVFLVISLSACKPESSETLWSKSTSSQGYLELYLSDSVISSCSEDFGVIFIHNYDWITEDSIAEYDINTGNLLKTARLIRGDDHLTYDDGFQLKFEVCMPNYYLEFTEDSYFKGFRQRMELGCGQ